MHEMNRITTICGCWEMHEQDSRDFVLSSKAVLPFQGVFIWCIMSDVKKSNGENFQAWLLRGNRPSFRSPDIYLAYFPVAMPQTPFKKLGLMSVGGNWVWLSFEELKSSSSGLSLGCEERDVLKWLTCNQGMQIVVCISDACVPVSPNDELNQFGGEF